MNITRHFLPDLLDQDDDLDLPNLAIDATGTGHCDLGYLFAGRRLTCFHNAIRKAVNEAIPDECQSYLPKGESVTVNFCGVRFTVTKCYDLDVHKGYRIAFRRSPYVLSFDMQRVRNAFGLNIQTGKFL